MACDDECKVKLTEVVLDDSASFVYKTPSGQKYAPGAEPVKAAKKELDKVVEEKGKPRPIGRKCEEDGTSCHCHVIESKMEKGPGTKITLDAEYDDPNHRGKCKVTAKATKLVGIGYGVCDDGK